MAIYFFDKNQTLIKIAPDSATFEAIQTQELDDDSLLKDTLSVTVKGDENLLDAEYMAVKSYTGNAQAFDMYRIVTDTTPDKSMSFTGMSLAPYELNGHIIQDLRPTDQTLSYTLNRVLDGTDWQLGYIDDGLSNVTTTFYYVSAKEALKELQSLVGCEFVFKVEISGQKITDKWIEVYSEMGNRTKKRFNYGTNALTVVRETNKADIYTALIGRGKGEEISSAEENESGQAGYGRKITFEEIEWSTTKGNPVNKPIGQYYLELPQATQAYGIKNIDGTMTPRIGIVEFADEEDKNRLINLTYQQLLVSSRPKVLFKSSVANIGGSGIGDTVTIHRHDLNIHYQTRVRKIVRDKLNDNKTQIELGDAVVTPSTKRAKQNNATIKNLNQEIEKVKADVTISQTSADGKNTINYGSTEPERKRTGDTWYRPHPSIAGETQMLVWNGNAWELVLDSSDLSSVAREVEVAKGEAEKASQAAKDADGRANTALEKAGANANLLQTHQNTLNTINNTTIPNINSSISDAMAEAQSALSSASSAMDEAKKADGKIADYVTKNGLVSGTTVDSKINTATGEINKKITTVESKIVSDGNNLYLNSEKDVKTAQKDIYINTFDIKALKDNVGKRATVSFDARILDDKDSHIFLIYKYQGSGLSIEIEGGTKSLTITKDKKRFVVRGTITDKPIPTNYSKGQIIIYDNTSDTNLEVSKIKIELGEGMGVWSPAPEDNYSKEEFAIFESTYNEDVKGINSTLTELSNKKLDGSTYTTFYNNEYKKTAQGVTDTYAKVNKIIDANGNSTDAFAKAVYDKNATRQSADFKSVTDGLVKTATYESGIDGVKQSITSVRGDLDNLSVGGRNYYTRATTLSVLETVSSLTKAYDINGFKATGGSSGNKRFRMHNVIKSNGSWTISGYFRGTQNVAVSFAVNLNDRATSEWFTSTTDNTWKYFEFSGNVTNQSATYNFINFQLNSWAYYEFKDIKVEKGKVATDWSPAPEDMLGKETFTLFKNDYDETAKEVSRRLTAIDSGKEGSFAYRLNKTESTASGNSQLISTINKNYVKQSNIDASILADKQIKDTRNTNELPPYYYSKYPKQEVREFKLVSVMGIGSGTYGILTTNVPWGESSGGRVQQTFDTETEKFTRQGSAGWSSWVKQIDTADTTYQKITQTSSLYERVIGSTEANVKSNMARIVMTDSAFQTEIVDKQDLRTAMASGTGMTADPYFAKGANGISVYDNGRTGTISITRQPTSGTAIPAPVNKPYRLAIAHGASSSTSPNRGGIVNITNGWANGTVVVKFTAYLPAGRSFAYANNSLGTGATHGWLTDNKGTGKWETYMYYYRFGTGTISNFGHLSVTGSSSAFTWYLSEYDIINVNETSASKITQLADNINLKVSKADLISQINVQAGGVLITSGTNKLNVTPTTTYIQNGTIKSAMIESLEADKIITGTLDAGKVKVINLDANNITGNKTSFIQSNWNAINSTVSINASGIRSASSNGDWTLYHSGAVSFGNSSSQGIYLEYADGARNGLAINNRGATNTDITLDLVSSARNTMNFGRRTDTNGYDFRIDHYQGHKVSFDGRGVQRYTFNVNSDAQSHAISILGHGGTSGYNDGSSLSIGMETADGVTKGSRFYFSSTSDLVWLGKNSYSDLKPLAVFDIQFRWGQNGRKSMKDVLEYLSRASGVDINNIPDV